MAKNIEEGNCKGRVVLQQCQSAKLMVQPANEESEAKYVEVSTVVLANL